MAIVGGSTAAASAGIAANKSTPEAPKAPQAPKAPDVSMLRRRAREGLSPRGAYGSASGSMLSAPSTGAKTLLGQ
jgi:hypothetical protein